MVWLDWMDWMDWKDWDELNELNEMNEILQSDDKELIEIVNNDIHDLKDIYKLSKESFDHLILETKNKFYKAIVQPGDMVGVIAAHSASESTMQMTLNTFHYTGVSSKSQTTTGVPRITEIISLTKNLPVAKTKPPIAILSFNSISIIFFLDPSAIETRVSGKKHPKTPPRIPVSEVASKISLWALYGIT